MAKKEVKRWWTWKGVLFVATFLDLLVMAVFQFLPVALGWMNFAVTPWVATIFDFVVISFVRAVQLVVMFCIEFTSNDAKQDAEYVQMIVEVSTCLQWFYFLLKTFIVIRHQAVENVWFWAALVLSYVFSAFELFCIVNWNEDLAKARGGDAVEAIENEEDELERIRNRPRLLKGHGFLRIFSAMHIIMFHICSHDQQKYSWISITFINWGASHLTLFFILSGFVLAYQYYDKNITLGTFMFKRFARLYPLLWFSILITLPALRYGIDYNWKILSVLFVSIQTWLGGKYMANYVNWPSWTIGAFMFNYLIFPASLGLIKQASPSTRWWYLMPLFYLFTLWQMLHAEGRAFTVWYYFNTAPFGAHTPSFLIGIALGCNFVELKDRRPKFAPFRWFGASICFFLLLIIWFSFDFWHGSMANQNLAVWSSNGMLAPLFAALIWFTSCETDLIMWWWERYPMNEIGQISFTLYITQNAAKNIMAKWYCPVHQSFIDPSCYKFFFPILIAIAMPCYHWIEQPFRKMLTAWWMKMKLDRGCTQTVTFNVQEGVKILFYYLSFFALIGWFFFLVFQGVIGLLPVENNKAEDLGFRIFKWMVTLGLPALLFNLFGHMRWPAVKRVQIPELEELVQWDESDNQDDQVAWRGCMHVRLVTRGKNPNLVLRNAETCVRVLKTCPIPPNRWRVEICTDNALYIQQRSDEPIDEILVPKDYRCPRGGKYKARALHYGATHWPTDQDDWIIHLDEETRFDANTVRHIYYHCSREHRECASGMKPYPNIGQGVILYGVGQTIDNYFTCLADCIRVADDFGKFRLQYENHAPWIGMHGSFVVCPWRIEKEFGFDHGLAGSITEDAYFALVVWAKGVQFSWIDAFMYEQSPFTALDFIRQRARWFGGLYLVVKDDEHMIDFSKRFCLGLMTLTWAFSPLICIAMVTCLIIQTNISVPFRIFLALASALSCWGYILGYVMTFRPSEGGWMKYICLFYCTLVMQQFFAVCEISGILHTLYRHPSKGFFIVQKEAGGNLSNTDKAAITEQDVEKERHHRKGSLLSQVSEHSSHHSIRSRSQSHDFRSFRKMSTGSATSRHSYRSTPVGQATGHPDYDGLLAARRAAGYQSSLRSSAHDELGAPLLGHRSGSIGGQSTQSSRSRGGLGKGNNIHRTQ